MKKMDARNDAGRGKDRKFAVDSAVRARPGTVIEWADDFPIGGWTGTVAEIKDGQPLYYLVEWSEDTLENSHFIHGLIASRAGDPIDAYYLEERELEPAIGDAPMEQPSQEYLERFQKRDRRIRDVFAVAADELIPNRSDWSLRAYYVHLARRLTFPFEGFFEDNDDPDDSFDVTVVGLSEPREHGVDLCDGFSCECREQNRPTFLPLCDITVKHDPANGQLVADYAYWIASWEEEQEEASDEEGQLNVDVEDDDEFDPDDQFEGDESADYDDLDEENPAFQLSAAALARKILGEAPKTRDNQDEFPAYDEPLMRRSDKVGRNDPCPCGSGKKFKKCCLKPGR